MNNTIKASDLWKQMGVPVVNVTQSFEEEVLASPEVHNWIKPIIKQLDDLDPVDAIKDIELLLLVAKNRLKI